MNSKRFLAALAAGAMLFAACGDDDGGSSSGSNEYSEALAASLAEDEDLPFESGQVDCLAQQFVGAIGGPEKLEAAGISPEDLRDSEDISELDLDADAIDADAVAASFGNCDISLSELILAEAGDDVPDEVKQCVADALDEDALADFFAATLIEGDGGSDDLPPEIMEALFGCF